MANTDKQQPDFNKDPDHQPSRALSSKASSSMARSSAISRNIEDLQSGMRIDFDQKLAELSDLLSRFKAMVVAPPGNPSANDANNRDTNSPNVSSVEANLASNNSKTPVLRIGSTDDDTDTEKAEVPQITPVTVNPAPIGSVRRFAPEPARFESGLYKLNSQLYRFRLELDQEMEFREEPLHTHFHQESELSVILQKISDKSREKNPDN